MSKGQACSVVCTCWIPIDREAQIDGEFTNFERMSKT